MPVVYRDIEHLVHAHGLTVRGGLHPGAGDDVPDRPGTLVLVGNAGSGMWQAFATERAAYADRANPLDDWVRDRLQGVAAELGGTALFPFGGPPFLPFQRWAQQAEPVSPSPLGVLIHPEYGLWHAWRGALAFKAVIDLPAQAAPASPCADCADKPCLSACPVGAFSSRGYDVPACLAHLETPAGADCMTLGCRARRACPVGVDLTYDPAQAGFHMQAFRAAQRSAR